MKKKNRNCALFTGLVLLCLVLGFGGGHTFTVRAAGDVSLVRGDKVYYMGYETHYYYVDGQLAYCLEPDMKSPGNGTYPSGELEENQLLAKAMYYVYGGPGFDTYMKPTLTGGWDEQGRSYCLSHCILSYIYDGCNPDSAGFIGLNEDIRKAVVQYTEAIGGWPEIPKTDLTLSAGELSAYFSEEEKRQRTDAVSCIGDPANSLVFTLPEGVALVNTSSGTEQTGQVEVRGGEQFYLAADVSFGNGTVWESGPVRATLDEAWRTLVVKTGGGSQDVGSGHLVKVEPATVELTVSWLPVPELKVDKYADKTSKTYKVGDIITYTVDVTQQIQRAVAKNVVITDTILTDGVKLQKDSIVLLDSNLSVISDAVISISGNSYTIHAGEFLQSIDTGEKYTVEYQVAITDEELIGKEVENGVIVRADNAEEKDDEEIVKVEEPEEPEEPPKEPEEPEDTPDEEPEIPKEPEPIPEPAKTPEVESVKTGDGKNLIVLMLFVILSCAAIITCVRISYKTK